jgi:MFS family permease
MMRRRLKASKMSNPTPPDGAAVARHDPYAALRIPEFRKYLAGNFLSLLGIQMQTFAVSWEIYERTDSKMALAWVGLVQIVPVIGLFLQAGRAADIFDRRKIMIAALTLLAVCSLSLSAVSAHGGSRDVALFRWESSPGNVLSISEYDADTLAIYVVLLLVGTARSFFQPARSAYLPQIVPREVFSNAVTWNSSGFQLATVTGPAVGGFLVWAFDEKAAPVYLLTAALIFIFIGLLTTIASRPRPVSIEPASFRSLAAGLSFVWRTRVMFGAIVLDMFAVLLGGATALLPVYAKDILIVGPLGLGWMRAAPGIGALAMSVVLAYRPPMERAGRSLLWSVVGFGVATILYGFSRSYVFSVAMLLSIGALDMISVVIRHTLVQLLTPDEMRGRVSAVNGMFIGVSNELGEFESGTVAHLFDRHDDLSFGPTVAVVSGGIGTLVVVAIIAVFWPEVRRYNRLGDPEGS